MDNLLIISTGLADECTDGGRCPRHGFGMPCPFGALPCTLVTPQMWEDWMLEVEPEEADG